MREEQVLNAGAVSKKLGIEQASNSHASNAHIQEVMMACLRSSLDPKNDSELRYMDLQRASQFAEEYKRRTGNNAGIPPELSDPQLLRRGLLAHGQAALAHYVHDINSSSDKPSTQMELHSRAQSMIDRLAADHVQSDVDSYRVFGGREAFAEIQARARRDSAIAARRDIENGKTLSDVEIIKFMNLHDGTQAVRKSAAFSDELPSSMSATPVQGAGRGGKTIIR